MGDWWQVGLALGLLGFWGALWVWVAWRCWRWLWVQWQRWRLRLDLWQTAKGREVWQCWRHLESGERDLRALLRYGKPKRSERREWQRMMQRLRRRTLPLSLQCLRVLCAATAPQRMEALRCRLEERQDAWTRAVPDSQRQALQEDIAALREQLARLALAESRAERLLAELEQAAEALHELGSTLAMRLAHGHAEWESIRTKVAHTTADLHAENLAYLELEREQDDPLRWR